MGAECRARVNADGVDLVHLINCHRNPYDDIGIKKAVILLPVTCYLLPVSCGSGIFGELLP